MVQPFKTRTLSETICIVGIEGCVCVCLCANKFCLFLSLCLFHFVVLSLCPCYPLDYDWRGVEGCVRQHREQVHAAPVLQVRDRTRLLMLQDMLSMLR